MRPRLRQVAATVGGIAIGLIGMRQFGLNMVFLILSLAVCWWGFARLGLPRRLLVPLSFTAGHAVWFVIGIAWSVASGTPLEAMIEIGVEVLVVAALVAWVCLRRSKASLCGLIVYEALSIGFNVLTWSQVGTMEGILLVHMAMRVMSIVGAVLALIHYEEIRPRADAALSAS